MKDRDIITKIRQGEKELFDVLARRYYQDIYRFCYYRTGDREAAYDCTQETYLRLIRFLDSYVDKNRFKAWLLSIAGNVCRDYFRNRTFDTVEASVLEETPMTEPGFSAVETGDDIRACLNLLPDYQQEVIILRFYHELKIREIAVITGTGIPTVKSRLKQGMAKMKRLLLERGGYDDEA